MAVGKIFSQGGWLGDFKKFLWGVAKSGEICFFPLETMKTTFFVAILKIQGGQSSTPALLPAPMANPNP